MRPWRVRLAARRSRVQWALLAVVLLVSITSATLLGTLHLLSVATETFAARAALDNVPAADVRIIHRVTPSRDGTAATISTLSAAAAAEHMGAVPFESHVYVTGEMLAIPREGRAMALGYLGYTDTLEETVNLIEGDWPRNGVGTPEVIVPPRLLWDLEAEIGDTVELQLLRDRDDTTRVRVVGTWAAIDPEAQAWAVDRLDGEGYRPDVEVPFTNGLIRTDAYGPLFTTLDGVETFPASTVVSEFIPDFSQTSLAELSDFIGRTEGAELGAQRTIAADASDVVVTTIVDQTLGGVVGSLAVTRSSVLVTGLLLLVLAVAALSQTARLMAERRHGEQHLMVARGGSVRQMVWLGMLEAVGLGVLTTLIAAPLARQAYLLLASVPVLDQAGLNQDPGLPVATWVVVGSVGFALVVVLVAPLLKRTGSFVDSEQAKSRPGKRAAFQRSGLDVAVVVLAALAYWQLRNYRSPVLDGGGVARVDPLLAAGPALALLAGGLVAVRLIPAASRLFEGFAARGRKAVMPLAAWEVGRRTARAVSAVLLLTLAISIGTFAMAFLASWQKSQQDQALFQHPPDVIVEGLVEPPLAQASAVDNAELDASASPVINGATEISAVSESSRRNQLTDEFRGRQAWLTATDSEGLRTFGRDRLHEAGGSRIPEALAHGPIEETDPIELPAAPQALRLTAIADISIDEVDTIVVYLNAVVRDSRHQYQTISLGMIPADGEEHTLTGRIVDQSHLTDLSEPLWLVGLQARFFDFGEGPLPPTPDGILGTALTLSLNDLMTVVPVQSIPVPGVPDIAEETPLDVPTNLGWTVVGRGAAPSSTADQEGDITFRGLTTPASLRLGGASVAMTAAPAIGKLPIVASGPMLDRLAVDVGAEVILKVEDTLVDAWVIQRVPRMPGDALRRAGVAANFEDLQIAVIQAGGTTASANEWWVTLPAENYEAYADALPPEAQISTRSGLAREFAENPLRVGIQAALWLVTGAAAVLAALGFAVHAVVTVRARETEFAQLRAVGIQRGQLLRVVAAESALLSVLGVVFGVGLGIALAYLVAPLVSVGADGRAPIPSVDVVVPWSTIGLLALEVLVVLTVTIVIVSAMLRRINPAEMLRGGDER